MNIFILDKDPEVCAKYHVDKHIVKMPTETAQMLSFVYWDDSFWDKEVPDFIMKFSKTHYKHPCSIWIRESLSNFKYASKIGLELYNEYQYRYNKPDKHKRAKEIFEFCLNNPPNLIDKGITPFAKAMSDEFIINECAVECYREYYKKGKNTLHTWTKREKPNWI